MAISVREETNFNLRPLIFPSAFAPAVTKGTAKPAPPTGSQFLPASSLPVVLVGATGHPGRKAAALRQKGMPLASQNISFQEFRSNHCVWRRQTMANKGLAVWGGRQSKRPQPPLRLSGSGKWQAMNRKPHYFGCNSFANYLAPPSCLFTANSPSITNESRPAGLVMTVTDF
jgi:hypothetical protein